MNLFPTSSLIGWAHTQNYPRILVVAISSDISQNRIQQIWGCQQIHLLTMRAAGLLVQVASHNSLARFDTDETWNDFMTQLLCMKYAVLCFDSISTIGHVTLVVITVVMGLLCRCPISYKVKSQTALQLEYKYNNCHSRNYVWKISFSSHWLHSMQPECVIWMTLINRI